MLIQRPENVREFMIEYLSKMKQDEEGVFDPELVPSSLPAIFEEKDMVQVRAGIVVSEAAFTTA